MPADTVREISVQGFKSISSLTVELRPINIVIGANGSGKSNFLEAFSFLREIAAGRLRIYVTAAGGAEKLLHLGSKTTDKIHLRVVFEGRASYDLILAPTADDGLLCWHEEIKSGDTITTLVDVQDREAGIGKPGNRYHADWVREEFHAWQRYHLHDTSYMCKTAAVRDNDFLRANGSNLPAFLYYLRNRWRDCYAMIVHVVRQVAPFFDDFELNPDRNNPDVIQLVWRHRDSDQYYFASSLSDGTLRFIAIATLLLQPPQHRRSLLLIDEPELGLHPYAIGLLAALIKQAAVDTQLIVSTQSSALLDNFKPEDVLVAERVEGGTQFSRQDPERLKVWLEEYSLGQLWEKNELGGRPGSR